MHSQKKNMKTRKYLFLFLVSIISLNINGQLKVKSNGKAIVGTELTISQDIYNVLTMNIQVKVFMVVNQRLHSAILVVFHGVVMYLLANMAL